MLELKNIKKVYKIGKKQDRNYQHVQALKGINVSFREHEFVSILGPSGCGKTTLLNIIGGLDKYSSGDLIINGKSTKDFTDKDWDTYRNHRVGFVFQTYNLIPHLNVYENVELALTLSGINKKERKERIINVLHQVGLSDKVYVKPNQLSGGQMQRVSIARALVNDPEIILADEPTGALDSKTSVQIMELLKKISKTRLIIMVTHNPDLANKYSTRIIKLFDGELKDDSLPYEMEKEEVKPAPTIDKKKRMSFFTALSLSFKNLLTKKARTILVSFAGSIGIIGIALILALSSGFSGYINKIQEDSLSSYPIIIEKQTFDPTSLLTDMFKVNEEKVNHEKDKIYSSEAITSMFNVIANATKQNDLKTFYEYLQEHKSDIENKVNDIQYAYDLGFEVYTADTNKKLEPSSSALYDIILTYTTKSIENWAGIEITKGENNYTLKGNEDNINVENLSALLSGSEMLINKVKSDDGLTIQAERTSGSGIDLNKIIQNWAEIIISKKNDNYFLMKTNYTSFDRLGILLNDSDLVSSIANSPLPTPINYNDLLTNVGDWAGINITLKGDNYELKLVDNEKLNHLSEFLHNEILFNSITNSTTKTVIIPAGSIDEQFVYTDIINGFLTGIVSGMATNTPGGVGGSGRLGSMAGMTNIRVENFKEYALGTFTQMLNNDALIKSQYELVAGNWMTAENKNDVLLVLDKNNEIDDYVLYGLGLVNYEVITDAINKMVNKEPSTLIIEYDDIINENADFNLLLPTDYYEHDNWNWDTSTGSKKPLSESDLQSLINDKAEKLNICGIIRPKEDANNACLKTGIVYSKELADNLMTKYNQVIDNKGTTDGIKKIDEQCPSSISIYVKDFDSKDAINKFITTYNKQAEESKTITYNDTIDVLMKSIDTIISSITYVLVAFVSVSLIVSSIMIGIITYISVLERTKEIGILRSIGASKRDIKRVFTAESLIIGFTAGVLGILITLLLTIPINAILKHVAGITAVASLPFLAGITLVAISVLLTFIAGLVPSRIASKKNPVIALRTE